MSFKGIEKFKKGVACVTTLVIFMTAFGFIKGGCTVVGKGARIQNTVTDICDMMTTTSTVTTTATPVVPAPTFTFTTTKKVITTTTTLTDNPLEGIAVPIVCTETEAVGTDVSTVEDINVDALTYESTTTTSENDSNETYSSSTPIQVTDYEYIILCNLVAGEYGSDWVSTYDKGAVVATVIHRLWEGTRWTGGLEPTIYNVISAPCQYDGKYLADYYAWNVTESCKEAVDYALNNMSAYDYYTNPNGEVVYMINSFYGDGQYNWFRCS